MLGQYYKTWDGVQLDFIGAINVHTIGAKERMIGNYMYRTTPESSGSIVSSALRTTRGKTYLGEDVAPLGMMLTGLRQQRRGSDRGRTLQKRVRAPTRTAPCCRRIPMLCDFILQTALDRRYGKARAARTARRYA